MLDSSWNFSSINERAGHLCLSSFHSIVRMFLNSVLGALCYFVFIFTLKYYEFSYS